MSGIDDLARRYVTAWNTQDWREVNRFDRWFIRSPKWLRGAFKDAVDVVENAA